jgi:maltooligosyltrehalose trehalohydrolase
VLESKPVTDPSTRTTSAATPVRRLPVGAEVQPQGGVHFRVYAPGRRRVQVVFDPPAPELALSREPGGYWSGLAARAAVGARYAYRLDDDTKLYPDPASRFQPEGPHRFSQVIDPGTFAWSDAGWSGLTLPGQVVYEMHVGTFTPEGTWEAAAARLPHLRDLGVTAIELMPAAEFPGSFGWGYDGVDFFAPYHLYGRPDQLRAFVDRAHHHGLGVILDVVYNHFGPDGNYLGCFAPSYFSDKTTEWGQAINYDGADSGAARELIACNAAYWIDEFHLDGLRLDATQSIFDQSPEHIIAELTRRARTAAGIRTILLFAENEAQHPALARSPEVGGYGLDCLWNDDFHHTARVALTGRTEAYYTDYKGSPQELLSAARRGYLYQGQWYVWQKQRRGQSARGLPPRAFAAYLQNHDQVANSAHGRRIWQLTDPGRFRALTGFFLLGPWTPMLFQGQEWNTTTPFVFFAEHEPDLARLVQKGRAEFLSQFDSCAAPEIRGELPPPHARATFEACKLDWDEPQRPGHAQVLLLHRELLALRREDPVIRRQGADGVQLEGAVLSREALALRFCAADERDDRLLLLNLGCDLPLRPIPEPLLAPPDGTRWVVRWSSEDPRYGGEGTPPIDREDDSPRMPGHAAVLLVARPPGGSELRP